MIFKTFSFYSYFHFKWINSSSFSFSFLSLRLSFQATKKGVRTSREQFDECSHPHSLFSSFCFYHLLQLLPFLPLSLSLSSSRTFSCTFEELSSFLPIIPVEFFPTSFLQSFLFRVKFMEHLYSSEPS